MIWEHSTQLDRNRAGIYYLRNTSNDTIYIGSTTRTFEIRWLEHLERLTDGTHHNKGMQADYNAGHLFACGILCILTTPDLVERVEKCLIVYYKDGHHLYNVLGVSLPFDYYKRKN
ncbi:GIY-YIG nuclease family protein [Chloroflexales bacterium ZM16-3]|nr:GIY-YIG nuclease family protein [Chloroflexales bacterium ZM16-3]